MYEPKTKETDNNVFKFIERVENERKREDAYKLLDIFHDATNYEAKMWGTSIIGFGKYRYTYKSGHTGEAPFVGFSPRKAKISLYLASYVTQQDSLLNELGKHTKGKSCVYINKVADIDVHILRELIKKSVMHIKEVHPR